MKRSKKMRPVFSKIMILVLAVLMLGACAKSSAVEIGEKAPDFSLPDINGQQVSLSDFKGKAMILNFFASWCPPCRQEVPDFIELQASYGGEDFTVLGIALVNAKDARNFASQMGINYPVLVDDESVSNLYGPIRSIPTTFIVNKDGNIVKMYIGFRPKRVFESDIEGLLK